MMSRSYRDDSLSDVFSEDEVSNHGGGYATRPTHLFSPNTSVGSVQDVYSPRTPNRDGFQDRAPSRDIYSPAMSNYSTYSQEVKYIFDPNFGVQNHSQSNLSMCDPSGNSTEDDYSKIQFTNKKPSVQRKPSNSSQYSQKSNLSNHSNGHLVNSVHHTNNNHSNSNHSNNNKNNHSNGVYHSNQSLVPPPPPPRTSSSSSSQLGEITQRQHPMLSHSMSASYTSSYYYPYNQTRRKTWSPEGLRLGFNAATCTLKRDQRIRSYSNEQLLEVANDNRDNIYEELEAGPPKIAPISGKLNKSPGRGIVRPIAFKPVVANQKFLSPPKQYAEHPRSKHLSHDDGYGSQDYGVTNQNAGNISHGSGSSQLDCDRSASFSSDFVRHCDRPDSVPSSNMSRLSENPMDGYVQTPSPSDSGVGELEVMLKEKDAEINVLREVMDKNERAIFQVYEDKKGSWIKEFRDLKEDYEKRLKMQQRKSYKSEQVLNLQLYKLQQDKKAIKEQVDKLTSDKEDLTQKCEAYADETNRLQTQMDDATWQGRRPTGDTSDLPTQVASLHNKLTAKSEEVLKLQSQIVNLNIELEHKDKQLVDKSNHNTSSDSNHNTSMQRLNSSGSDIEPDIPLCRCEKEIQTDFVKLKTPERETLKPSLICEKDKEVLSLKDELDKIRLELLVNKEEFEKEKEQWCEEKNKVIMYQKQLQLNYVQMFRKNKVLEAEMEQLTLELESRDMKLMALNAGEESVC